MFETEAKTEEMEKKERKKKRKEKEKKKEKRRQVKKNDSLIFFSFNESFSFFNLSIDQCT